MNEVMGQTEQRDYCSTNGWTDRYRDRDRLGHIKAVTNERLTEYSTNDGRTDKQAINWWT